MNENSNRAEAERLLGIAEKLLQSRDFNGTRDFAVLAQETEPLLEGSDQILAVADVLLSAEKRINNHHDWYAILQIDRRSDDQELLKKQYRRLALLLHPDKNKFPLQIKRLSSSRTLGLSYRIPLCDKNQQEQYDFRNVRKMIQDAIAQEVSITRTRVKKMQELIEEAVA
ncbi:hypothetical protein GH714_003362 [Hevea brasiliensis]|uniref:J domain-containing protein n=1 Tax=Hevea brasiliensis TaxID=3981 RepID=A0A6A6LGX6_HEVBR|nr:hypothetical protein GH714_003362 [Hevea brasiliensis]